jgi:hypothetical protein
VSLYRLQHLNVLTTTLLHIGSTSTSATCTTSGGPVPGGRGVGTIDVDVEEQRDADYRREMVDEVEVLSSTMTPKANDKAKTSAKAMPSVLIELRDGGLLKSPQPGASMSKRSTVVAPEATGTSARDILEVEDVVNFGDDEGVGVDDADNLAVAMDVDEEYTSPVAKSSRQQKSKLSEKLKKPVPRQAKGGTASADDRGSRSRNPQPRPRSRLLRKSPASAAEDVTDRGRAVDGVYRSSGDDKESSAEDEAPPKAKAKANGASMSSRKPRLPATSRENSDSDSRPPRPRRSIAGSSTPVKTGMKPKPKSKETPQRATSSSDDDEIFARPVKDQSSPSKAKVKVPDKEPMATSSKAKERRNVRGRSPPRTVTRSPSPPVTTFKTPKRTVSVLIPSLPKDYVSPSSGKDTPASGKGKSELTRTNSIRVSAAEASTSRSKRGRPSLSKPSTSTPVKNKSKSKSTVQNESEPEHTSEVSGGMDSSTSRGLSKRSAANKATSKLRDEIMPDVMNFEKERKNAKRRRSSGLNDSFVPLHDEEEIEQKRDGKRRKVDSSREEDEGEEAEVEEVIFSSAPQAKSKTGTSQRKGTKKRAEHETSVDEDEPLKKTAPKGSQKKKGLDAHNVNTKQLYVICSRL